MKKYLKNAVDAALICLMSGWVVFIMITLLTGCATVNYTYNKGKCTVIDQSRTAVHLLCEKPEIEGRQKP